MLQASDLTKAHDGAALFDGLSFVLGDGAGRPQRRRQDDAARVLSGVLVPAAGTVELAGAVRVLPQTPVALPGEERVVDWLRGQAALDEGAARTVREVA